MATLLEVQGLDYADSTGIPILQQVNLLLQAGEKVALVGANGSGKTTLLLQMAGCLQPQAGTIRMGGTDISGKPQLAAQHLGLLFQNPDVQLLMPTVREEIALALQGTLTPTERTSTVEKLAAHLGCGHLLHLPPHRLSAGEKQMVALAALLINQPSLLLLDEPSAALDPYARRALIDFLRTLDKALCLATHDLDLALALCTRTIILSHGTVAAEGPSAQLLSDTALLARYRLELPLCLQGPPNSAPPINTASSL